MQVEKKLYSKMPLLCETCGESSKDDSFACPICAADFCSKTCQISGKDTHKCRQSNHEQDEKWYAARGITVFISYRNSAVLPFPGPLPGVIPKCLIKVQDLEDFNKECLSTKKNQILTAFAETYYYVVEEKNYIRMATSLFSTEQHNALKVLFDNLIKKMG